MLQETQSYGSSYSSSYGHVTQVRELRVLTSEITSLMGLGTAPTCWLWMARSRGVLTVLQSPNLHVPQVLKSC